MTILFILIGASGGFAVSAGVFALITSLSLLPRMADLTRTSPFMRTYEDFVVLGGMTGVLSYFCVLNGWNLVLPEFPALLILLFCGLFTGIFIGTLSVSIAENLNVTAVLGRRAKLHHGLGTLTLSFAIGKTIGSLLFFYYRWF